MVAVLPHICAAKAVMWSVVACAQLPLGECTCAEVGPVATTCVYVPDSGGAWQ